MHSRIYCMNAYELALTRMCIKWYTTWIYMHFYRERLGCTITHICIERHTTRMHINWNGHTYAFKDVLHECINTDTHTHMYSRIYYIKAHKTTITHIYIEGKGYTKWMHIPPIPIPSGAPSRWASAYIYVTTRTAVVCVIGHWRILLRAREPGARSQRLAWAFGCLSRWSENARYRRSVGVFLCVFHHAPF